MYFLKLREAVWAVKLFGVTYLKPAPDKVKLWQRYK